MKRSAYRTSTISYSFLVRFVINGNSLFTAHSIIALIFGLGFLLAPVQVISMYGNELNDAGALLGLFFGSMLLAIAAVLWLARDAGHGLARQAIIKGLLAGLIVGTLVSLQGVLTGAVNLLGWSSVIVYAALAYCYSRCLNSEPSE